MSGKRHQLRPRFRVMSNETIALGPGKVDLLRLVAETSSISEAARKLGMSSMRAWTLIRTMNRCFTSDLILCARGGRPEVERLSVRWGVESLSYTRRWRRT